MRFTFYFFLVSCLPFWLLLKRVEQNNHVVLQRHIWGTGCFIGGCTWDRRVFVQTFCPTRHEVGITLIYKNCTSLIECLLNIVNAVIFMGKGVAFLEGFTGPLNHFSGGIPAME